MTVAAVHQFLPTLSPRDAIGAHTLQVQEVLRSLGLRSDLYADVIHPDLAGRAHRFDGYTSGRRGEGSLLLYQASTGSRVAEYLLDRPEDKVLNYHNITPIQALAAWEPGLCDEVADGRRQLGQLASVTRHAIAVSRYNQCELVAAGYGSTSVAPLLLDLGAFDGEPHRPTLAWLDRLRGGGGADLLFVGRIVPNKAQHDLVRALAVYRRLYDPRARLHLVGGASSPAYLHAVKRLASRLGLREAVDLPGSVSHARLVAYYRGSDAFVCLSDHEGFCVPVVEAMYHRLPIVAFASSAVPETVGEAGVVLPRKDPLTVAAAVARVLGDAELRDSLRQASGRRIADFGLDRTRPAFGAAVGQALAEVA
ncbi:MAG: glycosyltransferase [Acidimicrobiales bacterium]